MNKTNRNYGLLRSFINSIRTTPKKNLGIAVMIDALIQRYFRRLNGDYE